MRLLIVKALDDAHLYSISAHALARGLAEHGCEAELFDPRGEAEGFVRRLTQGDVRAVVSFSSFLGMLALDDGRSVYDVLGVDFVGWQFDHPIYVDHNLGVAMQRRRSIWANGDHLAFATAMGVSGRAAVSLAGAEPPSSPPGPWRPRPIGVLVAATWNGRPERVWTSFEDSPARRLLEGVVERLLADPLASLSSAYEGVRTELGLALPLSGDVLSLLRPALNYVRHHDRLAVVEALAASGLPLDVYGEGWEAALGACANVRLHTAVPFAQIGEVYRQAKVVVNLNAANGACERATGAMMAGAAVVSDDGSSLRDEFGEVVRIFDRTRPQSAVEAAGRLLEDAADGEAVAQAGCAAALRTASWTRRAAGLLAFLEA